MPLVAAFDDVKDLQFKRQSVVTPFLQASGGALTLFQKSAGDTPDLVAFLRDGEPHAATPSHFHTVDQFQVMVGGNGMLGRHQLVGYCVHFARAYTPYGPLVGNTAGLSFFTLRARPDPGARYLPESSSVLKGMPQRRPWQITRRIQFPPSGVTGLQEISGMKDERGLFGYTLTLDPDSKTYAPDPSGGDGQYLIAVKGSLWHGGKEHKSYAVVFVEPKDGPLLVHAGAQGLEAIILNFPKTDRVPTAAAKVVSNATAALKRWQCELCAFAYDESAGLPEDGIAPGTRWQDIPQDWTCPDCGTSKTDFQAV